MSTTAEIPLAQAASLFPVDGAGRQVHPRTLRRWATKGVRLGDGRVVTLPTTKVGRRRSTTPEQVRRFVRELNPGAWGQEGVAGDECG